MKPRDDGSELPSDCCQERVNDTVVREVQFLCSGVTSRLGILGNKYLYTSFYKRGSALGMFFSYLLQIRPAIIKARRNLTIQDLLWSRHRPKKCDR